MAHVNEGVFFSLRPEARDSAVAISRKTWDLEVPVLDEMPYGDEGAEKGKTDEKKMALDEGRREKGHGRQKTASPGNGAGYENESAKKKNKNKVSVRVTADAWKDERCGGIYYFHVSELYGFVPGTKPRDRCRELEKSSSSPPPSSSSLSSVSRRCMTEDGGARAWDRHTVREVGMERLEREGRVVLGFALRANRAWGVEIIAARLNGAEAGGQEQVRVVWDRRVVVDVSGWCRGEDTFRR